MKKNTYLEFIMNISYNVKVKSWRKKSIYNSFYREEMDGVNF